VGLEITPASEADGALAMTLIIGGIALGTIGGGSSQAASSAKV
jgi:hypothetical protein